tara:strand:- start:291 stop:503 length:213 start_codon:yes stop_codon:yes gene_type:complete
MPDVVLPHPAKPSMSIVEHKLERIKWGIIIGSLKLNLLTFENLNTNDNDYQYVYYLNPSHKFKVRINELF